MPTPSPYEAAIPAVLALLHPRLRLYFSAIPRGSVGRGEGVFHTVGTPRRWMWPVLAVLARRSILFPVWQRDVPFTVENRPVVGAGGHPGVAATRTFRLAGRSGSGRRDRDMVDVIAEEDGSLIDRLGLGAPLWARFDARAEDGALLLRSNAVALRFGTRRLRIPRVVAPRVTLREAFDESVDRQRVDVTLSLPLVGLIYEYRGTFRYEIRPEQAGSEGSHTATA
ncbi:DUF4166 domain-containing protein [Okibacterium fritillariae]|uniref:DUF4166 domain-containing protein n=1 Tax=Okibacterium fritillariae TaxID=123320 RepID=UPI0040554A17